MTPTEKSIKALLRHMRKIANSLSNADDIHTLHESELDTLAEEFRNVGKLVLTLPKQFKAFYSEVVGWDVMESWTDSTRSDLIELTPDEMAESLDTLLAAEEELARHTEGRTAIQGETIANGDIRIDQERQDLDFHRRTPHIYLWFTAFLIPIRAGLDQVGWELTGWQVAAYLLFVIPLWMMMKANTRQYDIPLFYPSEADSFATQTEFYDVSQWGRFRNVEELMRENRRARQRRRRAEGIWKIVFIISIVVTINAKIMATSTSQPATTSDTSTSVLNQ